jgi:hypothetical protein
VTDYDEHMLAVMGVLALGPAIPREIAARVEVGEGEVVALLAMLVAHGRAVRLYDEQGGWTDRYALIVR